MYKVKYVKRIDLKTVSVVVEMKMHDWLNSQEFDSGITLYDKEITQFVSKEYGVCVLKGAEIDHFQPSIDGNKTIELFYEDSTWLDNVLYVDFKLRKLAA